MAKNAKISPQEHLELQRDYVKKQQLQFQHDAALKAGGGSGMVDERMLAESMRSVRYHNEHYAAGDIFDNGIESGATCMHAAYKTKGNDIEEIAFIDDGSGIVPEFLPHAVKWGGSSNDGRRNIFGRFGFGLPSASVNRGRAYDVYSRVDASEPFRRVTVDLDNLTTDRGLVRMPKVVETPLPTWIQEYVSADAGDGSIAFRGGLDAVRSVVVWRKFDRLVNPKIQASVAGLMQHLGITYAGWLPIVELVVQGKLVEPVDVLFTTPEYRWYDILGYPLAEPQDSIVVPVKDKDGEKHEVVVRFSRLPMDAYQAEVPLEGRGRPKKVRQRIRMEYNGIFITRNGRFIELANPRVLTWNPYARQVGMAIDFPPALDELFGVTPDKQSINMAPALIDLLESAGAWTAFRSLYKTVSDERSRRKAERDAELNGQDGIRPSEETIEKVIRRSHEIRGGQSKETIDEAQRNLKRKVKEIAAQTGMDEAAIAEAQEQKASTRPYRVQFQRQTDQDPFYTPTMEGTQMVLIINTGHPWYTELYSRLDENQAQLRSGLELFLWVLGAKEIDSSGEKRAFYRNERRVWSRLLADSFDIHPGVFSHTGTGGELDVEAEQADWVEEAGLNVVEESN